MSDSLPPQPVEHDMTDADGRIDAAEFIKAQHAYALAVIRLVYGLTDDEIVRRLEAPDFSDG